MMRRFLFACAVAASLAAGVAQARQASVPSSASASVSVPAATPIPAQVAPPVRAAAPQPMTTGPAAGSLLQTIFALCLVLALLAALAWFMKRFGPKAQSGSAHVRLVGALSLGGRERIMVVEVGDQWIVVGASPGRINALATMPRKEGVNPGADASLHPYQPTASSFAEWLKQTIDKRNAK